MSLRKAPAFTSASRSEGNVGLSRSGHQVGVYNVISAFWHRLHQAPAFGPGEETCRVEVAHGD